MGIKRILFTLVLFFLGFLALYTWNSRTDALDDTSTNIGLEITGGIIKSTDYIVSGVKSLWFNYIDLTNVREENEALKNRISELENALNTNIAEKDELRRLRSLHALKAPEQWQTVTAKVVATKLGAFSALESILINKGYLSGVSVGRPIMTDQHLLGRIYQASPTSSIGLLIDDLGSRVAVISGTTRVQGILRGMGSSKPLELHFVGQNSKLIIGEILYTSGLDSAFPKNIPVARITSVPSGHADVFQIYKAEPLANFSTLEEIIVLLPPSNWVEKNSSPVLTSDDVN